MRNPHVLAARHRVLLAVVFGVAALSSACAGVGPGAGTVELRVDAGHPDGQHLATSPSLAVTSGAAGAAGGAAAAPGADEATVAAMAAAVPALPEGVTAPSTALASPAPANTADASAQPTSSEPGVPSPAAIAGTQPAGEDVAGTGFAADPVVAHAVEGLSSPQLRSVSERALGLIVYDWQHSLPGWELRFLDARAGYRGLTYPDQRLIELYVRSGDTPSTLAHVVAHELGHAVDVTWFSDADRTAWIVARRVDPQTSWFVAPGGSDFASGAGDFAESFAWWQVGAPMWFGELAGPPSVQQLGRLVELVLHP